jgi:hypothetical protein
MATYTRRPQKRISFTEMRESGVRGLLVYCADYRCSHSIATSGDPWPVDLRLSAIEPRFVACGGETSSAVVNRWLPHSVVD